jgi:hypothetical protein
MWYAPIGSIEYTINLHNDILIKKYILSEQRLKQQNRIFWQNQFIQSKNKNNINSSKGSSNILNQQKRKKVLKFKKINMKSNLNNNIDTRINRIKGCAVDVLITRSFRKTSLNVVTYDSTFK